MKICMITDAWDPIWGGGQEHIWQLSNELIKNHNCQIDFFTRNLTTLENYQSHSKSLNGFKVIKVGPKMGFHNPFARLSWIVLGPIAIWKKNKIKNYDLIHSHGYSDALVGKIASKLINKPQIHTVHGSNLLDLGKRTIGYFLVDFLLTKIKFSKEISVTKSFAKYSNVNKPIVVIPNGVNIAEFDKVKANKSKKSFKIIWVGRKDDPIKGVKYLEEAYMILKKNHSEFTLSLITQKYGMEKINEFKSADVFVLPSLSEGLPLVLLEAMAACLPIVTTDVGDCRELIEKSKCGVVVLSKSTTELVSGIEQIYKSKNHEEMGQNGHDFVKNNYNWTRIADQTFQVYQNLIK